jgi:tetratricopeptide (TPR) repeat protein
MQVRSLTGFRLAALLVAMALGVAFAAPADDLKEAQKLYNTGKLQPALEKVDAFLKAQPKDPQGRFLKGLVLTEQKKTAEAIQVFTALTEDYPELPEPYNNLAVLYASQGNYEKAKSALELAIHTHPSYATAHENLGDIYAQLASRAYDRALQLDKTNTSAQVKLSMVKDIFSAKSGAPKGATPSPASAPAQPTSAVGSPGPTANVVPAKAVTQPDQKVAKAPTPPVAAVKPAPAPATSPPPVSGDAKAQAIAAVENWARAWSAKDVKGYLGSYAPEFEVPGGAPRAAWEKERTEHVEKPKRIEVGVKVISAEAQGNEATVVVRQSYKSDTHKSNSTKTLKLVRSGERWLIKQETVGG